MSEKLEKRVAIMPKHYQLNRLTAAKRFCWDMYSDEPWFFGCVYNMDTKENHCIEIRVDPNFKDPIVAIGEYRGIKITRVPWSLEEHGEDWWTTRKTLLDS